MITRKRCKFCQHEDRLDLESRMSNMDSSPDELDKEFGWPSGTTSRHMRNHASTEYEDKSNPSCPVCTHEHRSKYEVSIHEGELSPTDLAEALGTSPKQIHNHMKNHLQPLVQKSAASIIAQKEVDEIEMLSYNVQRLDTKIDTLFRDDHDLSPRYIDSLTKLAKEVRESLKYLLEFKGKLIHRRQDTVIVAQMQIVQEVLAQQHPDVWLDVKGKLQEKMQ